MTSMIFPFLKVGHETVHNVLFGGKEVKGVHITIGGSAISDILDVWNQVRTGCAGWGPDYSGEVYS